jgi:hypothetical protein
MTDRIEATATLAAATVIPPLSPIVPGVTMRVSEHLPASGRIALKLDESAGGETVTVDVPVQVARRCALPGAPTRWRVTIEPVPSLEEMERGA